MRQPLSVFRFKREQSNGWDERYLSIGRILLAWGTLIKGEPWEGPWIGLRFSNGEKGAFVRLGLRPFVGALGFAKKGLLSE